ncbi:hypothetical protein [Prevotella nigrescens]|uniref:hypothetical protein n=1 Tax=Prevotella nigrescens TaxID=28133 RepID=UPI0012DCE44E|nr:hypothetical protein [Prevotella nigrescens]
MKSAKRKGMPDICPAYPDNQYKNEKISFSIVFPKLVPSCRSNVQTIPALPSGLTKASG